MTFLKDVLSAWKARRDKSLKKNICHYFSNTPLFIAELAETPSLGL